MAAASTLRRADGIEIIQRWIRNEDCFIRAHGKRVLERLLRGLGSDAQSGDCSASRFLLLKRAFDRVLVERVDDQRRVAPKRPARSRL
jgi:hypothetical protein